VTSYDESFRGVGAGGSGATTVVGGATVPSRDTISTKLTDVPVPATLRLATSPITIPTRRSAAAPAAGGAGATGTLGSSVRADEPGFRSSATLSRAGGSGSGSPDKKRVVTTAYSDLDGPGANPYELMKHLGFAIPTGSTRRSGAGAAASTGKK
jgi:hypothetical protein